MKNGARAGNLTILAEDDLDKIYRASLDILMNTGVYSESDLFIEIFDRGGAKVDKENRIIYIPPELVEWAIQNTPKSFVLYGRNDPAMDLQIELGRVYYGMGGTSEPMFWDFEARHPRQPTKQDMINNTRIGHALENIDFVQTLCMSGDVPTSHAFFHDFDAILRNTTKPTVINVLERPFTQKLLAMVAAASGGESALREKPCALGIVTPITPLKIAIMNEGLIDVVQAGLPVLYSPGPLMGATGPATVAGTVVLTNAEVLFGVVLTQLIQPGAKVVLKPDTDVFDMRTTQVTYGSPEQDLGKAAMVQLAKRYGIPIYGLGGGVEAKLPDAEAAAEATLTLLLVSLAGMTMCQANGTLCFGQYGSPEMAIICDEIIYHIKRILQGFEVNDDTLAVEVIRQAGHGGSFLNSPHTLRYFRKELFFPRLFQRQTIDEWLKGGGKTVDLVAHEKALAILEKAQPVELPPGADTELERALRLATENTY